jgi:excisionase family DNA binding protein
MIESTGDGFKGDPPAFDSGFNLRDLLEGVRDELRDLRNSVSGFREEAQELREEVQHLRREVTALNEREEPDVLEASLSPDEVAERLGISRRTLDDLEAEGKITAVQVKGQVRYEPQEVADFIRRNRRGDGQR